jgi:hypothetical protein
MSDTLNLTPDDLVKWVRQQSAGRIFRVTFRKRSDGSVREMVCRIGVAKHLAGGEKSFDDEEKNLLTVFDFAKQAYRSIPLEGIISVKIEGQIYKIVQKEENAA